MSDLQPCVRLFFYIYTAIGSQQLSWSEQAPSYQADFVTKTGRRRVDPRRGRQSIIGWSGQFSPPISDTDFQADCEGFFFSLWVLWSSTPSVSCPFSSPTPTPLPSPFSVNEQFSSSAFWRHVQIVSPALRMKSADGELITPDRQGTQQQRPESPTGFHLARE